MMPACHSPGMAQLDVLYRIFSEMNSTFTFFSKKIVTVQPYSSISPLRGFSAATQLQISLMAERHMPGIKIISLFEQAQSRNYLDCRRMAELLQKVLRILQQTAFGYMFAVFCGCHTGLCFEYLGKIVNRGKAQCL